MDSLVGGLCCLLCCGWISHNAQAGEVTEWPYNGVTLITRTNTVPRSVILHLVRIDLTAPGIRFKLSPPAGGRDTLRQTTLEFLTQERAQLAINAHFYLPFGTPEVEANLAGFAVSEGVAYSPFEPQPLGTNYADQSYAILPYAPALNLDRCNRASILTHDVASPDPWQFQQTASLWTAVAGSAQIITEGRKTIPTYTGAPTGLNPINGYSDLYSWYDALRARTIIGLSQDRKTLFFFTVDEIGGSLGMTLGEAADLLIGDYQVYDAINLDGDGSTTLAMEDPGTGTGRIVNNCSGGPLGRSVGSSLAVFAPANDTPPMRLTISLASATDCVLSWPFSTQTWQLQWTPSFAPGHWENVPVPPERQNSGWRVLLSHQCGNRFFRLERTVLPGGK